MKPLETGQIRCPNCGYDNSKPHNDESALPEGTLLSGKFLVGKMIGRGGFGMTYIGYDPVLQKRIAIKEYFPPGLSIRAENSRDIRPLSVSEGPGLFYKGRDAFQSEAVILARFNSPYIVRVNDFFRENNTSYIIMDFVGGESLNEALRHSGGRMPWERVISLFNPLIRELGKLHAQKVIHRDIKPGNIKLVPGEQGETEHLVILDFGAARNFIDRITKTYTAMLTPGYGPTEQYSQHSRQGPFTDVYAVCATMYRCITGEVPPASMDMLAGARTLKPFENFGIRLPSHVKQALLHGMALESKDRTQTMEQLYRELNAGSARGYDDGSAQAKRIYDSAKWAMSQKSLSGYQEALRMLNQIPGYRDSAALAEICLREINAAKTPAPAVKENRKKTNRKALILPLLLAGAAVAFFLVELLTHESFSLIMSGISLLAAIFFYFGLKD